MPARSTGSSDYLNHLAARLAKVVSGACRDLIITMPPRHLKSICVSVALPAFYLGHHPSAQVLAISYGQELAKKFAEDTANSIGELSDYSVCTTWGVNTGRIWLLDVFRRRHGMPLD